MKLRILNVLFTFAVLCASSAFALTEGEIDFECPLDGEKYKQVISISGTYFGIMLDFKPFGPITAPWPLPICPTSGFVVYRDDFKPEEFERLRTFVASPEYVAVRSETPYYRVAKLQAFLGDARDAIAYSLLQATWEAKSPDKYARYARETLASYQDLLASAEKNDEDWLNQQLIAGELERRLGLFEEARERFSGLKNLEPFETDVLADIVALQLQLIERKDSTSYRVPRNDP